MKRASKLSTDSLRVRGGVTLEEVVDDLEDGWVTRCQRPRHRAWRQMDRISLQRQDAWTRTQ